MPHPVDTPADMPANTPASVIAAKAHWYILGAGAIGCLWAACFVRAGFTVTLLTRNKVSASEITLTASENSSTQTLTKTLNCAVEFLSVADFVEQQRTTTHLLITTKAPQTLTALRAIDSGLTENTLLLVIQNGLAAKAVATHYPNNTVMAGVTTDGAYKTSATDVVFAGKGSTFIGRYNRPENYHDASTGEQYTDSLCTALLQQLPTEFLAISPCNDIELKQWQKLAVNCACNALTAIYRCRNGELLSNTAALATMQQLCTEVAAVTEALGFPLPLFADSFNRTKDTLRITANNYSSMYKDIEQGRATEIDCMNGYVCAEAERLGIPSPANRAIVNAIKKLEQANRK